MFHWEGGGSIAQWLPYLFPDSAALDLNHCFIVFFQKNYNVAVLFESTLFSAYNVDCEEELNSVDQTDPVIQYLLRTS